MQIARVIGTVVATRKNMRLDGAKLLLVHPIDPEGAESGSAVLAVDAAGAGVGETVLVVIEGRAAGDALGKVGAPVDAAIIGIVDTVDLDAAAGSPAPAAPSAMTRRRPAHPGRSRAAHG